MDASRRDALFRGLFFAALLGGSLWLLMPSGLVGKPGPEIDALTLSGQPVHLSPGEPTLLSFWATWCGPCIAEMPVLEKVYQKFGHGPVRFLAVDVDEPTREQRLAVSEFVEMRHFSLPVALDQGGLAKKYQVTTIPHLVLIDRAGMVIKVFHGGASEAELDEALQSLAK